MTESGVNFWIVVAMAARQDVIAAVSGGWMAILANAAAVAASFITIPVLARFGKGGRDVA
jgi:malonate transporter MadL subunit